MAINITMPRLSDTMEQGTVVKWHVNTGDSVNPGDVIADIETDKATMELEAFDEGTVAALAIKEGQTINVGETIVVLAEDGEDETEAAKSMGSSGAASASTAAQASASDTPSPSAPTTTAVAEPPTQSSSSTDRVFASPLARKIADEHNINLGSITGSGPSGRIVKKDVVLISNLARQRRGKDTIGRA